MLIDFQNLNIIIQERTILSKVYFTLSQGEFVYIIGRVGSGKSSLLKTIYAEQYFEGDKAIVLEQDLTRLRTKHIPALRRQMGMVFQDFALLPHMTVEKNLDFVLRATDWKDKEERQQRIDEVLEQVEMLDKKFSFPHELSGGEQQRIAIARALLNRPQIILADEPTGNLDHETSDRIMQLLRSLTDQGTAVVMVTHNLSYLRNYPGVVYRCHEGTLREASQEFIQTDYSTEEDED
ncbi:MAG: ATP-binding cassette domain-containing protein [Bacteroidales bacterium]|nr:ATP-binding cassette domain-containing protein [Bacteroidales bacterium]